MTTEPEQLTVLVGCLAFVSFTAGAICGFRWSRQDAALHLAAEYLEGFRAGYRKGLESPDRNLSKPQAPHK